MRVRVLGSAAGGGVPQWNCACENCSLARERDPRVKPRTQDSIAVAAERSDRWLLINVSPDVLRQIEAFEGLWPRTRRETGVAAIALTNGDLDHVLGLLSLRESQPLRILSTGRVRAGLVEHNAMLRTLARSAGQVTWTELTPGRETAIDDLGLLVTAIPAQGKLPVHLMGLLPPSTEDNVALRIRERTPTSPKSLAVLTAVGALPDPNKTIGSRTLERSERADPNETIGPNETVRQLIEEADAILLDGTFWSDDELVSLGLGTARASDMAHIPVGGAGGSLERLKNVRAARRVFTHINNTNPMLREDSPERAAVERAGWEVAFDGMEFAL